MGADGQQEDEDPNVASVLGDMVRDHGEVQVQTWLFVVAAYAMTPDQESAITLVTIIQPSSLDPRSRDVFGEYAIRDDGH